MCVIDDIILQRLAKTQVVAGFSVDHADDAPSIASALLEGGIDAIELTLRTPAGMDAVRAIAREVPEVLLGVGTILTPDQCREASDAGAAIGMSPGTNPDVVKAAQDVGLVFSPGIATPSDIEVAVGLGCRLLKYFPAEALGGVGYLKSMATPYVHLEISYFPLGGINTDNMKDYLNCKHVAAIGGSWIVQNQLVQDKDWGAITERAREVRHVIDGGVMASN